MLRHRIRQKGLSLIEMLVVTAIMSIVGAFTAVLYTTAFGDYESTGVQKSMTQYARNVSTKITQIIATAVPRSVTESAFRLPVKNDIVETSEANFLSTGNFIKVTPTETSYAFDDGESYAGYQNLFRYSIMWSGPAGAGSIRPNTVYLERRTMPLTASGLPDDLPGVYMNGSFRQPLGSNIGYIGFKLTFGNTLQSRIVVYSVDPVTGRGLDGQLMRTMTKRRRQNSTGGDKVYELLTSIPIPTVQIK